MARAGIAFLLPKATRVAITKMQGAGKSVLHDYITGVAFKKGYQPPEQSQDIETKKTTLSGKPIVFSVIPGQWSGATKGVDAIDDVFNKGKPIDLLIHVVANGFASMRGETSIRSLIKDFLINTIPKYRNNSRKDELNDLREICAAIRLSQKKNHTPARILIAIDKVDLYEGEAEKAIAYYSTDNTSEFVQMLVDLRRQVGTDNLAWDAMPVCAHLENFRWHKQTTNSTITPDDRTKLLAAFLRRIQSFCK